MDSSLVNLSRTVNSGLQFKSYCCSLRNDIRDTRSRLGGTSLIAAVPLSQ
jgi:hypothetical protein